MDITLYKRKDSAFYWMKWTLDQRLYRESTKTTNLKKAKKIARKKEDDLLKQKGIAGADEITLKDMIEEVLFDYRANGVWESRNTSFHGDQRRPKMACSRVD